MAKTLMVFLFILALPGCKSVTEPLPITDTDRQAVQVLGGTYQMGSTNILAVPPHSVTLGSFYIETTEVTYARWREVYTWGLAHGYTDLPSGRNGYNPNGSSNPVTEVSWYDVLKWCNARSEMDGVTPVYYTNNTLLTIYKTGQLDLSSDAVNWTANGYRLPTEAEWEFAARGGTMSRGYTYSGSNNIDSVAWYAGHAQNSTHSVAMKGANELGIYDMSGNVWEWCWDWYGAYSSNQQTNPRGPSSGSYRKLRGGTFNFDAGACRVADRWNNQVPNARYNTAGFRCVHN